eukprot:TRINITY_DN13918_c0_g2_i2.p1 TRINITY_DN13918_c0_g2~~TRINITY_DN13918_c0_g2_i2.p1  ORF type:complete len:216 (+),score=50.44 TRINITY_DN13918_c0_g2_i2:17-664(+)
MKLTALVFVVFAVAAVNAVSLRTSHPEPPRDQLIPGGPDDTYEDTRPAVHARRPAPGEPTLYGRKSLPDVRAVDQFGVNGEDESLKTYDYNSRRHGVHPDSFDKAKGKVHDDIAHQTHEETDSKMDQTHAFPDSDKAVGVNAWNPIPPRDIQVAKTKSIWTNTNLPEKGATDSNVKFPSDPEDASGVKPVLPTDVTPRPTAVPTPEVYPKGKTPW